MKKYFSVLKTIYNEFTKATFRSFLNSILLTIGVKPSSSIYKLKNNLTVSYEPGTLDLMVIREHLVNNLYCKYLKKKRLSTVVDLGSHKGFFVLGLLNNGVSVDKLIAVEPLYENMQALKNNLKMNKNLGKNLKELITEECAVSSINGKHKFYITRDSVSHSLKNPSALVSVVAERTVKTKTLESIFSAHNVKSIDLLKIDIEGIEFEIFKSKQIANILNMSKQLIIEIHTNEQNRAKLIINKLKKHGFTCLYPNAAYKSLVFAYKKLKVL